MGVLTMCELLQHFVQLVMRRPAILRVVRCPQVAVSSPGHTVMVIAVTVALPIMVFVAVMAIVVIFVILVITMVMVAVGDGCSVMQHLLLQGGDLPLQQLLQRGGVRGGRVLRLTTHVEFCS